MKEFLAGDLTDELPFIGESKPRRKEDLYVRWRQKQLICAQAVKTASRSRWASCTGRSRGNPEASAGLKTASGIRALPYRYSS